MRRQHGSVAVHLLARDTARWHQFLQTRGGAVRHGGSFSGGGGKGRVKGCALEIVIIPLFSSTPLIIVYEKVSLHSLTINMELQNFKYQI